MVTRLKKCSKSYTTIFSHFNICLLFSHPAYGNTCKGNLHGFSLRTRCSQRSHLSHRMCRYTQAHSYIGTHPPGWCSWLLSWPCRGCWHTHLCLQRERQIQILSFLAAFSALKSSINFNMSVLWVQYNVFMMTYSTTVQ